MFEHFMLRCYWSKIQKLVTFYTEGSVDTQSPSGYIHMERGLRAHFSHCVGHQSSAWGTQYFFLSRELLVCRIVVRRIARYKLLIWKCFVILGAFAPIHISLRTYRRGSHWPDFRAVWYWGTSAKICREIPSLVKIGQQHRAPYVRS